MNKYKLFWNDYELFLIDTFNNTKIDCSFLQLGVRRYINDKLFNTNEPLYDGFVIKYILNQLRIKKLERIFNDIQG